MKGREDIDGQARVTGERRVHRGRDREEGGKRGSLPPLLPPCAENGKMSMHRGGAGMRGGYKVRREEQTGYNRRVAGRRAHGEAEGHMVHGSTGTGEGGRKRKCKEACTWRTGNG